MKTIENLLSKCRSNNEKYSVNLFKVLVLIDQNQNEEVIKIYEDMIFHGYADSRIFSNLMNLYTEIGDYEKAEEYKRRAIANGRSAKVLQDTLEFYLG